MSEIKTVNPFDYLPKDKLEIIREDFYRNNISKTKTFEEYLKALHEDDELIPEEVLDIIEARKSTDWKTFSTADELIKDLREDD